VDHVLDEFGGFINSGDGFGKFEIGGFPFGVFFFSFGFVFSDRFDSFFEIISGLVKIVSLFQNFGVIGKGFFD